jgi:ankyrin repeat protein
MIELLLDRGANVSAGHESGFTPLRAAAHHGHASTVRLLLERGALADIDLQDKMGCTPLMWAANCGSPEMVRTLLSYGAERGLKNNEGRTAIDIALGRGHENVAAIIRAGMPLKAFPKPRAPANENEKRNEALERLKQRAAGAPRIQRKPPQP